MRALGVGLDKATQQAVRFRFQPAERSGQAAIFLSAVVSGQTRYLGKLVGNTIDDENPDIAQLGRARRKT